MTLDEAIKYCDEKAEELRLEAEQLRDIGERISSPNQPYNELVRDGLECAKEHEQLAEWLKELKGLRLLAEWAVQCGFGYDNIPEEYERYKNIISDLDYIEGLIYIAKKEAE